ncbi:hypothetical protein BT96DRAFT_1003149 [Gymnopus androsaceus JB14]|uniref:CxC2-like cysteine cluster KDZ transposase-associated domain-containing protein n=1 Tax=Gymnopus androsaceus JB14 TaxID=1447944 RepID=A0A6A4GWQ6_9AGAR|nr:hypothetical protein BT96DRAFT_1003149 [Gymnopus androsaceus JB14]
MQPQRPTKRRQKRHEIHDPMDSDEEIIDSGFMNTCESNLDSSGRSFSINISPRKKSKKSAWATRRIWDPPDDLEVGLDTDSNLYDQAVEGDVYNDPQFALGGCVLTNIGGRNASRSFWMNRYVTMVGEQQDCKLHVGIAWALDERWMNEEMLSIDASTVRPSTCYVESVYCVAIAALLVIESRCGMEIFSESTKCPLPQNCNGKFRILDSTGIHDVTVLFCGCPNANPQYIQLLRRSLYPATLAQGKIKTVATFRYLEQLHHLTLMTMASVYNFYCAIAKTTDNTGLKFTPWRYTGLMCMCLQWRHLKLLKRNGRGNDASGVAGTKEGDLVVPCLSCPHPGINLPDSWKSAEGYANMDYVFGSALHHYWGLPLCIVGYDIACQWFAHIHEQSKDLWPNKIKLDNGMDLVPVIGKFHKPVHETDNHEQSSCNLIPRGTKQRLWGRVHEVIVWKRILVTTTGKSIPTWVSSTLWSRYRTALKDQNRQCEAHQGLTDSLLPDLVDKWNGICVAWENAPHPKEVAEDGLKIVNPFSVKREYMTQAQVEVELALEDEMMEQKGIPLHNRTRPGKFILMGLALEESQYKLRVEVECYKKLTQTAHQQSEIVEHRNVLKRALHGFEKLRSVYMPRLVQFLMDLEEELSFDGEGQPETEKLWLPSSILADKCKAVCCDEVDHMLCVETKMVQFKNKNIRGQQSSGKSREVIDKVHDRVKGFVEKYCRSREGLLLLVGPGEWEEELRVMAKDNVRSYVDMERKKHGPGHQGTNEEEPGMEGIVIEAESRVERENEDEEEFPLQAEARTRRDGTGETRKQQSWIWLTRRINLKDGADKNDNEILRAEWCRSRARAHRAEEEVQYLEVEMERALLFLHWKVKWWAERQDRPNPGKVPHLEEGFLAMWKGSLWQEERPEEASDRVAHEELGLDGRDDGNEQDEEGEKAGNDGGDLEMPD